MNTRKTVVARKIPPQNNASFSIILVPVANVIIPRPIIIVVDV